jgi:hypothetical protein
MLCRGAAVLVGLLALQAPTSLSQEFDPPTYHRDPRLQILRSFFEGRNSPVAGLAREFLVAADRHQLDWRLLPSISVVESGGGKAYRNNNIFGWDNGAHNFPSVRDGIHVVASRLQVSKFYKNKSLDQKLSTYNPNPEYLTLVKAVMAQIGPPRLRSPDALN